MFAKVTLTVTKHNDLHNGSLRRKIAASQQSFFSNYHCVGHCVCSLSVRLLQPRNLSAQGLSRLRVWPSTDRALEPVVLALAIGSVAGTVHARARCNTTATDSDSEGLARAGAALGHYLAHAAQDANCWTMPAGALENAPVLLQGVRQTCKTTVARLHGCLCRWLVGPCLWGGESMDGTKVEHVAKAALSGANTHSFPS